MEAVLLTTQRSCRTHFNVPCQGFVHSLNVMTQKRRSCWSLEGVYEDIFFWDVTPCRLLVIKVADLRKAQVGVLLAKTIFVYEMRRLNLKAESSINRVG